MAWSAVVLALFSLAAAKPCALPSVQKPPANDSVSVSGDVVKAFTVRATDAGSITPVYAELRQRSGDSLIEGDFEGVSIADLFDRAGAKARDTKAGLVDSGIVARAPLDDPSLSSSAYEVVFSYSEISPRLSRRPAFLAFRCNGLPITPTIVAPEDLTDARYVHELSSLILRVER